MVVLFFGTTKCFSYNIWKSVNFLFRAVSGMWRIILPGVLRGFMDPRGHKIEKIYG